MTVVPQNIDFQFPISNFQFTESDNIDDNFIEFPILSNV